MFMTGKRAWHYVDLRRNVVHIYHQKIGGTVNVADYGTVIKSGLGEVLFYNTACLCDTLYVFSVLYISWEFCLVLYNPLIVFGEVL